MDSTDLVQLLARLGFETATADAEEALAALGTSKSLPLEVAVKTVAVRVAACACVVCEACRESFTLALDYPIMSGEPQPPTGIF